MSGLIEMIEERPEVYFSPAVVIRLDDAHSLSERQDGTEQ